MDTRAAEAFAVSAARSIHPLVASWYDEASLLANARDWLRGELRLVDDVDSARAFAAACPVAGVAPERYANRVIRFDDGLDVVAGIRHRPSAKSFFVDLVVASRVFEDAADVEDVARRLADEFAEFSPQWLRLYAADDRLIEGACAVDDHLLGARLADLRALPASESVVVTRRGAADVHDDYARLYAEFHAAAPGNVELPDVESLETLSTWAKDGGVFEILVDGARAGFCGAHRSSRYGVRGWCGGEIILDARFRGRGLASSAHRRMAAALDAAPDDAIWANVHARNAPSLRAGLRAGYSIIGATLRVPC